MRSGMKMMAVNEMRRRRDSRGRYMEGGQGGQMEMGYGRMEGGQMNQGNYNRMEGGGGRNRMEGGNSNRMGGYDRMEVDMRGGMENEMRRGGGRMEAEMRGGGGNSGRMEKGGNESAYQPWPDPRLPPYLNDDMRPGRERRTQYGGEMMERNVVNIRDYKDRRRIGFGTNRMHYGEGGEGGEKMHGHEGMEGKYPMMEQLTEEIATAWVEALENTDPDHPTGPKWSRETIKPLAMKHGFTTPEKQLEFWTVMNMMYSDYAETAKKHGVSTLDFYADMAKAWMKDKDAVEHKTAAYIACCTK